MLTVADDLTSLVRSAAERVTTIVEDASGTRGSAVVALTGGETAAPVYSALADPADAWRHHIRWQLVHVFWGDERNVAPSHPDSNFGMAAARLLSRVSIPASQIHRMRGELQAVEAASEYERELIDGFAQAGRFDATFDLMLLGLGPDAHIASIFPDSPVLDASGRAAGVWVEKLHTHRITLTPRAILAARRILMVVSGREKAGAVAAALEGPVDIRRWPAQLLRDAGDRVEWMVDSAAASALR
jgi:6-phosphogluconolactonase